MAPADVLKSHMIGSLRTWSVSRLKEVAEGDASREADWMLMDVLGCGRAHLVSSPGRSVSVAAVLRFREMVNRRLSGEPVQYILGWTEFFGLKIEVSPAVLIPRPETENLVGVVLREIHGLPKPRILDVGTGSGCIAVAIAHNNPDAHVIGVDVSEAALEIARRNAELHRADIALELGDVHEVWCGLQFREEVHVIVSNPPYIAADEAASLPMEVAEFEPRSALFPGDDPLVCYRALVDRCREQLLPGGALVLETHEYRARLVEDLIRAAPFNQVEVLRDLAGRERVVVGRGWKWMEEA